MVEENSTWDRKRATIAFGCFFALVAGIWAAQFTTGWFDSPDAYDFAQMGREIVRGHGLSTKEVFPRHIAFLQEKGLLNQEHLPNLYRYPMPTFANALAQLFISDPLKASIVQCGFWFLASLPIFFLLARGLVSPLLALVCTVLYAALPCQWVGSYNGLSESLTVLLLLLLLYVLMRREEAWWRYAGLGFLAALLYLTRTQFAYVFLMVLVYLGLTAPRLERFRALGWSALFFFLALSPWLLRNAWLTGNPLFSFHNTRVLAINTAPLYDDLDMQLHAPAGMFTVLREHWTGLLAKFSATSAMACCTAARRWAGTLFSCSRS